MPDPSAVVEAFSLTHAQVLDGTQSFIEAALANSTEEDLDIYGVNNSSLSPDADQYINEGDDVELSIWDWINKAEIEIQSGYFSMPLISRITGRPLEEITASQAVNEVQTITIGATGGTYDITYGGDTHEGLTYNAAASAVQAALEGLDSIGPGNVTVTGTGAERTVTFQGDLAGRANALLLLDDADATGGEVTIARTTAGSAARAGYFAMDLWHEESFNVPPLPGILVMPSRDKFGNVRRLTIGLYKIQFAPVSFDGPEYKEGMKVNMNGNALLSAFDELGNPHADGKRKIGRILSHE